MPQFPFSFEPFRRTMYSRQELFGGFRPEEPESYGATRDFAIYREYIASGKYAPSDYFAAMMQALHDNGITQALSEHLRATKARAVGVMGGHKLPRGGGTYRDVARLSRELTRRKFTMMSGGGPGAMEATHLGALLAGGDDAGLEGAIRLLATRAEVPDLTNLVSSDGTPDRRLLAAAHEWFAPAYEIAAGVQQPADSLAIPTWLYGHEPSSPLASHVAKYFQNSIREDGLLALATNGVIYVEGRAGTLQEIFQDAAQNYYRTFGSFSPMVFLGKDYWTTTIPAVPVLKALLKPEDFATFVLLTDDVAQAADFVETHGTQEDASGRMDRYLQHETHRREV